MKNMPPRLDLQGQRFGFLVAQEWTRNPADARGRWLCVCDCGRLHRATTNHLRSSQVKSCGCQTLALISKAVQGHGMSKTPIYDVWIGMRARCELPAAKGFENYGARGIQVCTRWSDFSNFASDMGPRPAGLTIERIDNDGNYEPANCRWATRKDQSRNQRTNRLIEHNGQTLCLTDWAEMLGLNVSFLRSRLLGQGMAFAEAIAKPNRYSVKRKARLEQSRGLN